MRKLTGVLFALLLLTTTISGAEGLALYVSPQGRDAWPGTSADRPFATLQRAVEQIRTLKQQAGPAAPVTVYLRGGRYEITEPVELRPEDSGTAQAPVTFTAYRDEQPVISGGRIITGWQQGKNGVWTVRIPEVRTGQWKFRELYVNGELRPRARIPNRGFLRVAGFPDGGPDVPYHTDVRRFQYAGNDLDPDWTNLQDVEVIVYHFWTDSHLPIRRIDPNSHIVTFQNESGKVFTDDFTDQGARYIVDNVYEGLDQPGEWYLNRKTGVLSYLPKPGEDMQSAEVIAPVSPAFLHLKGRPMDRQYVEHITFRGLTFMHTNWDLPPGNSNDQQGSASVPAAITLRGARYVTFDQCTVKNLGTFAFELGEGCAHNAFTHNELGYLAAGGFRVNGGDENSHPLLRTGYNVISDNHLHHFGQVFPSAVGVLLMHTNTNRVAHNLIHHGYYTGISVGWEWGYQRSVSTHNIIEYNHIHHIGQGLLSDMGAIYTLGVSPGTIIRNNLIHDVESHHYGGWGIYDDEGSTHILVENNIVYHTKFSGYDIHYGKELMVRNNIFALARINELSRTRMEPHKSVYFERNIVYWTRGDLLQGNWNDETYQYYFHPKDGSGTRPVHSTFEMDYNLYYNPNLPADSVRFGKETFTRWRARGKDVHSVYADPLFVDPAHDDFRLRPGSPAFDLGFQPIDMSTVGPRPVGAKEEDRP